jgi:hypothetical protein
MRLSLVGQVLRVLVLFAVMLATASAVTAQSITDGTRAEFIASTDHNAVDAATGAPIVERYAMFVYIAGGTTVVSSANLGKPAPGADGMVRLDFAPLLTTALTPGVIYEAIVSAVGPGGSADSSRSNTFAFGTPCAPSISPTSQSIAAAAGAGSSTVTVGAGCLWAAMSNAAWITITAGSSGSGSGAVTFSVAPNLGSASRTGTLTIAGSTFTVTQLGTPCAPAISTASANVVAAGITGSVVVTAAAGCAWTATSAATWITISAGTAGSGNGSVTYNVAANTGTASRTGTLTIGGKTFTVTQAGVSCTFSVTQIAGTIPATGGTGAITVTTQPGCAWTSSSAVSWMSVTGSATGSGTASYTISANTGSAARSGALTVAGTQINVTQNAPKRLAPPTNLRIVK